MANTTFYYLDKALSQVRDIGLTPENFDEAAVAVSDCAAPCRDDLEMIRGSLVSQFSI